MPGGSPGRPKGAKNKATLRTYINDFLSEKLTKEELDTLWNDLKSRERASLLTDLLQYQLPKLRAEGLAEIETADMVEVINNMSDEQANELLETLIAKIKKEAAA